MNKKEIRILKETSISLYIMHIIYDNPGISVLAISEKYYIPSTTVYRKISELLNQKVLYFKQDKNSSQPAIKYRKMYTNYNISIQNVSQ